MQPITQQYLDEYRYELGRVKSQGDVYGQLMSWQWSQRANLPAVLRDLNKCCSLTGDGAFLDHPPTTAVGNLSGIVVVAANPGWDKRKNPLEKTFRETSHECNRSLPESIFTLYPQVTHGTSGWWSKALKVCAGAYSDPVAPKLIGKALWSHIHAEGHAIGGVDLIPFHSTKDHITSKLILHGTNLAIQELRKIALATMDMAMRLQPKLLLIVSRTGSKLLRAQMVDTEMVSSRLTELENHRRVEPLWSTLRVYENASGVRVLAFPQQAFSSSWRAPPYYSQSKFSSLIRDAMGASSGEASQPLDAQ